MFHRVIGLLLLSLLSWSAAAQAPAKSAAKLTANSVYVVDSVTLESVAGLQQFDPKTIATVNIFTGKEAVDLLGEKGNQGVMYAETIPFARRRYWRYFRSKSAEYKALVPTPATDSLVQYILNKRVLTGQEVGDLALIDDTIFKSLRVLDAQALAASYGITTKKYGVVLESGRPKYLYNGRKKF
jgi:hypothetical protein